NLWASLVAHIFDNLRLADNVNSPSEELQTALLDKLEFEQKRQEHAKVQKLEAVAHQERVNKQLQEAKREFEKKKDELASLSAENLRRNFKLSAVNGNLGGLLAELGLPKEVGDAARDSEAALREARAVIDHGGAVLSPLVRARDWRL